VIERTVCFWATRSAKETSTPPFVVGSRWIDGKV